MFVLIIMVVGFYLIYRDYKASHPKVSRHVPSASQASAESEPIPSGRYNIQW